MVGSNNVRVLLFFLGVVLSRLFTKNICVFVALDVSYYRITYRITLLSYYCITGLLVTTSYGLL